MNLNNSFKNRKSLGEDVFETLRSAIIDQSIAPGSRLVETKLADMLGISRTPIREAIHKLEREDWVRRNPGGGFKVVSLTNEEIEETFGIRSVLEAYAARLAAENHSEKDLEPIEKKIKQYQKYFEAKEFDNLLKINTEFHDLLYGLSKSPRLIKMINQLREQIFRFRQILLKKDKMAAISHEDHNKMMELIRNRDGEGVERLVREHILTGKAAILKELSKQETKS